MMLNGSLSHTKGPKYPKIRASGNYHSDARDLKLGTLRTQSHIPSAKGPGHMSTWRFLEGLQGNIGNKGIQ